MVSVANMETCALSVLFGVKKISEKIICIRREIV